MILPASRVTAIWCGVGMCHLAALGAIWGSAGVRATDADGLIVVELMMPDRPAAPPARLEALPAATPVPPVVASAPAGTASPEPAAVPAIEAAPARTTQAAKGAARPTAPEFLERAEPVYPRPARLAGIEGVVRLRLRLDAEGILGTVEVAESSGSETLDAAAMEAARRSRYAPARVDGVGVPAETEASYRFRLR